MVDFLSDGVTFRGILAVLSVGADYLAAERPCAHGEALGGACSRAWRRAAALAMDKQCVDAMRERAVDQTGVASTQAAGSGTDDGASLGAFHSPLDQVMLRDASQCAAAIGYVSYRHNPALALASLKIFSGCRSDAAARRFAPRTPASGWCGAARACWSWRRWHRRRSGTRRSRVRIRRRPTTPRRRRLPRRVPRPRRPPREPLRPRHPRRTLARFRRGRGGGE